jgi:hypothetical protein
MEWSGVSRELLLPKHGDSSGTQRKEESSPLEAVTRTLVKAATEDASVYVCV